MDLLILGCSPLTTNLVLVLSETGYNITVLGKDRECLEQVEDHDRIRVIRTVEPLMQDYLRQGDIDTTEIFLALSNDDHQNVLAAQIALHIFNVPKVVCHLNNPQLQILYSGLGLGIVGHSFGLIQDVRQAIDK